MERRLVLTSATLMFKRAGNVLLFSLFSNALFLAVHREAMPYTKNSTNVLRYIEHWLGMLWMLVLLINDGESFQDQKTDSLYNHVGWVLLALTFTVITSVTYFNWRSFLSDKDCPQDNVRVAHDGICTTSTPHQDRADLVGGPNQVSVIALFEHRNPLRSNPRRTVTWAETNPTEAGASEVRAFSNDLASPGLLLNI